MEQQSNSYPAWLTREERLDRRVSLNLTGVMSTPRLHAAEVRMTELGCRGCRLDTEIRVPTGTFVTVTMPGIGTVKGWAVWQKKCEIGIDFTSMLTEQAVENAVSLT